MNRIKVFWIVLLVILVLQACSVASSPTSTPSFPPVTTPGVSPTNTISVPSSTLPLPSATQQPIATISPVPSSTLTPTLPPMILIGAGDIAYCGDAYQGDEQTAAILERFPEAVIFTAGDNVYGEGRLVEYRNCFGPSWGRFLDRLHPSPGNHDFTTDNGAPYYEYFGPAVGEPGQGYYSYDLGEWHVVMLNSNCDAIACGPDSRQAAWLRDDLALNSKQCTILVMHHPRWSSGLAGNYGSVSTFWKTAVEFRVELIVSGNDHNYERFSPQDAEGNPVEHGVRQFVVGTGGAELREFGEMKANSQVRDYSTHGVIKLSLFTDRYQWEFIPVAGSGFQDSGNAPCY